MFTKTKLTKTLAAVGICCLSTMALAGGPDMPSHDLYSGGFGLGLSYSDEMDFGFLMSYTTDELTFSLSNNLVHVDPNAAGGKKQWYWGLYSQLGFRDRLGMENLFLTYGAGGGAIVASNEYSGQHTSWYAGPFVGLDYQPLRHFMISGSIYPIAYEKDAAQNKYWDFFEEGNVSLSYIF